MLNGRSIVCIRCPWADYCSCLEVLYCFGFYANDSKGCLDYGTTRLANYLWVRGRAEYVNSLCFALITNRSSIPVGMYGCVVRTAFVGQQHTDDVFPSC